MGLKNKTNNIATFLVPHFVWENKMILDELTQGERNFFTTLCKLHNRFADEDGWFWYIDGEFKTRDGQLMGFKTHGLSANVCKSSRKKLKDLGLIDLCRENKKYGQYRGTCYRIRSFVSDLSQNHRPNWALVKDRIGLMPESQIGYLISNVNKKKNELNNIFNIHKK